MLLSNQRFSLGGSFFEGILDVVSISLLEFSSKQWESFFEFFPVVLEFSKVLITQSCWIWDMFFEIFEGHSFNFWVFSDESVVFSFKTLLGLSFLGTSGFEGFGDMLSISLGEFTSKLWESFFEFIPFV